jgi:hypothetical protein
MARKGGAKPGERRGGRKIGTPNKPRIAALEAELLARAPHPPAPTANAAIPKQPKDNMAEFAALFCGLAAAYQPKGKDENGFPAWLSKDHQENFLVFSQRGMLYSQWAASYFDPTYKAIAVVVTPNEDQRRLPGNVVDIRDAQTAANEYRRIVCGKKD